MSNFSWLWEWPTLIPELLPGVGSALLITVAACGLGYPIGFLLALLADSKNALAKWGSIVYVELGRGIPILVLLYLVYRGLPQLDMLVDAIPSAMLALTISASAYSAEMIRASIAAVPKGQFDASDALGLTRADAFRFVVIPQAARISLPPLVTLTITMFHVTSLASLITVAEIMHDAFIIGSVTFQYMTAYTAAAVVYAAIAIPGAIFAGWLEKKLGDKSRVPKRNKFRSRRPVQTPGTTSIPQTSSTH